MSWGSPRHWLQQSTSAAGMPWAAAIFRQPQACTCAAFSWKPGDAPATQVDAEAYQKTFVQQSWTYNLAALQSPPLADASAPFCRQAGSQCVRTAGGLPGATRGATCLILRSVLPQGFRQRPGSQGLRICVQLLQYAGRAPVELTHLNCSYLAVHKTGQRQVLTYACCCSGCFHQVKWQMSWALLASLSLQPQEAAAARLTQKGIKTQMHSLQAVPGWKLWEAVDQS